MVEIKNLTRKFGSISAVKDLSFTVENNEILGFLGPNGAGKSTTMNIITGCLPPTLGTAVINGYDILKNPMEAKKCIGYLPEIPPLYTDMKVFEYLKFVAGIKAVPAKERNQQIRNAMDRLKIVDVSKRTIKNLSKGYKQRVGFAQALIGNPKVLILDEPTVGLDPNQILEVRNLIHDLKKDHAIILSSHIMQEISAVCDRVLIINKGEMKACDTLDNLTKKYGSNIMLSLTVEGNREKIMSILENIKSIININEINSLNANSYEINLEIADDNARKEIISKLIAAECEISEVHSEQVTLEEIFAKITKQVSKKKTIHDVFDAIEKDITSKESNANSNDNNKEDLN